MWNKPHLLNALADLLILAAALAAPSASATDTAPLDADVAGNTNPRSIVIGTPFFFIARRAPRRAAPPRDLSSDGNQRSSEPSLPANAAPFIAACR